MTPYYYNKESFLQHHIITTYLEKGLEPLINDNKFLKLADMKVETPAVDKLYIIYSNLGFINTLDEPDEGKRRQEVIGYLNAFSEGVTKTTQPTGFYLSNTENLVALENSIVLNRGSMNREVKCLVDEIARHMYSQRSEKCFAGGTVSLDNLFTSGKSFEDTVLFDNESSYKLSSDECPNILGTQTQNKPKCRFFVGFKPTKEFKHAVKDKIDTLYKSELCGLYSSSNEMIYRIVSELLTQSGSLINAVKTAVHARKVLETLEQSDQTYNAYYNTLNYWLILVYYLRQTPRVSIYDLVSDIYIEGKSVATTKRIYYGNYDVAKTVSVVIETGTFKTSPEYLDAILALKGLQIVNTARGSELMAGKASVWNKIFGTTNPKDGSWLNLTASNKY